MYNDLLDSAKTGHNFTSGEQDDWWRSNSPDSQSENISLARASILLRFLYGDYIVLTHNQAIDSCAWFSIGSEILQNYNKKYQIPVVWAAYQLNGEYLSNPTPDDFVKTAIEIFRPNEDPTKDFKLSAWPGLDRPFRTLVANNLQNEGTFRDMFKGIENDIDSAWRDIFVQQQETLYLMQQYLKNYYIENRVWSPFHPTVCKPSQKPVPASPTLSIWEKLCTLREGRIPGELLDQIYQKYEKAPKELERRGSLYSAIADFSVKDRNNVRKYIDFFYNWKTGISATGGNGLYSITDVDPSTKFKEDLNNLVVIGESIADLEDTTPEIFSLFPKKFPELATLSFEDYFQLRKSETFNNSLRLLREKMINYPLDPKQLPGWEKQVNKILDSHQSILASQLENKITLKDQKLISFSTNAVRGVGAVLVIGGVVANQMGLGNQVSDIAAAVGGVIELAELISKTIPPEVIPITAAARIKRKIEKTVKRNI